MQRVQTRVREGGHNIPEPTIRRRYEGGIRQFFTQYRTAVDSWMFVNNSGSSGEIIAESTLEGIAVANPEIWQRLTSIYQ